MRNRCLFTLLCLFMAHRAAWGQWALGENGSQYSMNYGSVQIGTPENPGNNKFFVPGQVGIAHSPAYVQRQLILGYDNGADRGYLYAADVYGGYKNLLINASGGNVGIRTTTPTHPLTVAGQIKSTTGGFVLPDGTVLASYDDLVGALWHSTETTIYTPDKNVGIGTSSPATRLHVAGDLRVTGHYEWYGSKNFKLTGIGEWSFDFQDGDGNDYWQVWDPNHASILVVRNTGNVGVGTIAPAEKLDVNGRVRASAGFVLPDGTVLDSGSDVRVWETSGSNAYYDNGRVGVGTSQPYASLHVRYSLSGAPSYNKGLIVQNLGREAEIALDPAGSGATFTLSADDGLTRFRIYRGSTPDFTINNIGYIGLGTTGPSEKLDVVGRVRASAGFLLPDGTLLNSADDVGLWTAAGADIHFTTGRVGIGTQTPDATLDVSGEIKAARSWFDAAFEDKISFYGDQIGAANMLGFGIEPGALYARSVSAHRWYMGVNPDNGVSARMDLNSSRLFVANNLGVGVIAPTEKVEVNGKVKASEGFVLPDGTLLDSVGDVGQWTLAGQDLYYTAGNIGIGTTTPQSLLSVGGGITAREVRVTDTGWADFVFAEDYPLMPLDELERLVRRHRRLPGIPSADEIETEGLDLGEMQSKLLMKIEELTLYVIDLKKQQDMLKRQQSEL